jgi:hypothetical protein
MSALWPQVSPWRYQWWSLLFLSARVETGYDLWSLRALAAGLKHQWWSFLQLCAGVEACRNVRAMWTCVSRRSKQWKTLFLSAGVETGYDLWSLRALAAGLKHQWWSFLQLCAGVKASTKLWSLWARVSRSRDQRWCVLLVQKPIDTLKTQADYSGHPIGAALQIMSRNRRRGA